MNYISKSLKIFFVIWRFIACDTNNTSILPPTSEFTCLVQDFPFVVAIVAKDDSVKCAGTLIDAYFVLTAAHCVDEAAEYFVLAGISNPTADALKVAVEKSIVHPDFLEATRHNDIAVLQLLEPVVESPYIKFVILPKRPFETEYLREICENALIILWKEGYQRSANDLMDLECIFVKVLSDRKCKRIYQKSHQFGGNPCDSTLQGADTCKGDTGGPLLCTSIQTGVISWGVDCGVPTDSAMFTRIDQYLEFIEEFKNSGESLHAPGYIITLTSRSTLIFFEFHIIILYTGYFLI